MHFLADESCDFNIIRALQNAGYNIVAISEICPGVSDNNVLCMAKEQGRILLTEDKDFGEWVYAHGKESLGVIFIRFPANTRSLLGSAVV